MNRAGFLRSLALATGGLIVGGDLIEEMARRLHVRKSFPSAGMPTRLVLKEPYGIDPFSRYEHVAFIRSNGAHYMTVDGIWTSTDFTVRANRSLLSLLS